MRNMFTTARVNLLCIAAVSILSSISSFAQTLVITNGVQISFALTTNSVALPVDANNGSVFYRLTYP